jgi:hypothetical protein
LRVLALGIGLPDAQVDNYDWASALSFYDYDAVVVDPANAVSKLIEGVIKRGESFLTYTDDPVEAGPGTTETVSLLELLKRRREETARHLARGLIVCFAYPTWLTRMLQASRAATATTGCRPRSHDYSAKYLKPPTAFTSRSPITSTLRRLSEKLRNNVLAALRLKALQAGEAAKTIGRSSAAPQSPWIIGSRGHDPSPRCHRDQRQRALGNRSLAVTAIRNTPLISAEEDPPAWLERFPLPGLHARERQEAAEEKLDEIEREAEDARNEPRHRPLPAPALAGREVRLRSACKRRVGAPRLHQLLPAGRPGQLTL